MAVTSENVEDVCSCTAWLGNEEIAVSSDACFYRHNLNPKFVAYYFQTEQFHKQKRPFITGTKVRRVNADDLAKYGLTNPQVDAKVTFKDAFEKRRCIIPATGFYEWSEKTDTKKDPKKKDRYKIEMPNQEIMHMAGIYTKTTDESGQLKWQFTVVTREANADMGIIHHRMPLMLSVNDLSTWMDSQTPLSDLKELLNFDIGHLNVILDEPQIHIDTLL